MQWGERGGESRSSCTITTLPSRQLLVHVEYWGTGGAQGSGFWMMAAKIKNILQTGDLMLSHSESTTRSAFVSCRDGAIPPCIFITDCRTIQVSSGRIKWSRYLHTYAVSTLLTHSMEITLGLWFVIVFCHQSSILCHKPRPPLQQHSLTGFPLSM